MSYQKLIYLASPYSSDNSSVVSSRVRAVQNATALLIEQGHLVFSPIVHSHPIAGLVSFDALNHAEGELTGWMAYDEAMIRKADEVWVLKLDGWDISRGVNHEIMYAIEQGKTVRLVSYPSLEGSDFKAIQGDFGATFEVAEVEGYKEKIDKALAEALVEAEKAYADRVISRIFGDEHSKQPAPVDAAVTYSDKYPQFLEQYRKTADKFLREQNIPVGYIDLGRPGLNREFERQFNDPGRIDQQWREWCDGKRALPPEKIKKQTIIGLNGFAQTGKDTVGKYLVEKHGYTRVSFADAVRDALYALNPVVVRYRDTDPDYLGHRSVLIARNDVCDFIALQTLVQQIGWDNAKQYLDVRQLLQRMGTEVGRDIFGENIWIDIACRKIEALEGKPVVITDVRFPNEAAFVRSLGGQVVRVVREGVGAVNGHSSDQPLDDKLIDVEIYNSDTIDFLHQSVEKAIIPYV